MKIIIYGLIKKVLEFVFRRNFILSRFNDGGISLTFDDGPHPINTPVILDELLKRNIKVAFFVTGCELEKYPDLGKRIVAEGHLLGNHTYDHINISEVPFAEYITSIEKAELVIGQFRAGKDRKLFRPPYSSFSFSLLCYVVTKSFLLFNWSLDSRDSFIKNSSDLIDYVNSMSIINGDILLFHDDYSQTAAALPTIIDDLLKKGHQFTLPIIATNKNHKGRR